MSSLQTTFGSGAQFYSLLDDAATAAHDSAKALHAMMREGDRQPALDAFKLARLRERTAAEKISQALVDSYITPIEREDIEALGSALQRSPSRSRSSPTATRWPPSTWPTSTSRRARRCWSRPPKWWCRWWTSWSG